MNTALASIETGKLAKQKAQLELFADRCSISPTASPSIASLSSMLSTSLTKRQRRPASLTISATISFRSRWPRLREREEAEIMTDLRPYQVQVIDDVQRAIETGRRRVLAVAPTGSGKTVIGAEIIKTAVDNGKRVLVLAHTREIIRQTSLKLYGYGIEDHGIIHAGLVANPERPVQVASIQTLWTRAMRLDRMPLPPADLLIIDECHHCPAETYRKIIAEYPNAVLLGMTATPCRGDGRGLGKSSTSSSRPRRSPS